MTRSRWMVLVFPAVVALSLLFSVVVMAQEEGNQNEQPAITLNKTAGLDSSCGLSDVITVTWGTRVTFCYTATNTGSLTLTTHTLTDTLLGPILEESPAVLPPGASHWVTATWNVPNGWGPIEHCAVWTAGDPDGLTAQAEDCTTAYILAPTSVGLVAVEEGIPAGHGTSYLWAAVIVSGILITASWRRAASRRLTKRGLP